MSAPVELRSPPCREQKPPPRGASLEEAKKLAEEDPAKAIQCFEAIAADNKLSLLERYEALIGCAKVRIICPTPENRKAAKRELEETLSMIPKLGAPDGAYMMAESYKYLAVISMQEKNSVEAREFFKKARKACPFHMTASLDFALFLEKNKEYDDAIALCNEVLRENPNSPEFLHVLAKTLLACARFKDAIDVCGNYLRLRNTNSFDLLKVLDIAIECAEKLEGFHETAVYYLRMAYRQDTFSLSKKERAEKLLKSSQAKVLSECFKEMLSSMGDIHTIIESIQQFPEEAFDIFDAWVLCSEDQRYPLLYRAIACILREDATKLELAKVDLDKAIHIPMETASSHWNVEMARKKNREFKAMASHWLGILYMRKNYIKLARLCFKAGWNLSRSIGTQFFCYIALPKVKFNEETALRICDDALEIEPNSREGYYFRAQIYAANNNWLAARNDCDHCLRICSNISLVERRDLVPDMHDLAARASTQLEDHRRAYKDMRVAFYSDGSVRLADRFTPLLELKKIVPQESLSEKDSVASILSHMLESGIILLGKDHVEEALKIFDLLLKYPGKIEDEILLKLWIVSAKAIAKNTINEDFKHCHQLLDKALKTLSQAKLPNPNLKAMIEAEIHHCRALVYIEEKKMDEAESYFQRAWKQHITRELCIEFAFFLAGAKRDKEALHIINSGGKILGVFDELNLSWIQANSYFKAGKWILALETYETLIDQHRNTLSDFSKRRVYSALQEAAERAHNYAKAKEYALEACILDPGPNFVKRLKTAIGMCLLDVMDKHLKFICEESCDIPFLSLFLSENTEKLNAHLKHLAALYLKRARLHEEKGDFNKSALDYQRILTFFDTSRDLFKNNQEERSLIEKRLVEIYQARSKNGGRGVLL